MWQVLRTWRTRRRRAQRTPSRSWVTSSTPSAVRSASSYRHRHPPVSKRRVFNLCELVVSVYDTCIVCSVCKWIYQPSVAIWCGLDIRQVVYDIKQRLHIMYGVSFVVVTSRQWAWYGRVTIEQQSARIHSRWVTWRKRASLGRISQQGIFMIFVVTDSCIHLLTFVVWQWSVECQVVLLWSPTWV